MPTLYEQWATEKGIIKPQAAPQQPTQPAPQDNGLLSLIPFYDIANKAFTGRGNEISAGEVGLEAALTFLPFGKILKGGSMLIKSAGKNAAKQVAKQTVPKPSELDQLMPDFDVTTRSRSIPISYIPSEASARATPEQIKRLYVGESVDQAPEAYQDLVRRGYSARINAGTAGGYRRANTIDPLNTYPESSAIVRGSRTALPFGQVSYGLPEQLLPRSSSQIVSGIAPRLPASLADNTVIPDVADLGAAVGTAPLLMNWGSRVRGYGRDIRPGTKLPGTTDPLDARQALTINEAVDTANTGLRPLSGRGQLMGVQQGLTVKGKELGDLTNKYNRPLDVTDGDKIGSYVNEGRSKIVGFRPDNPAHAKLNNSYAERVAKAKDLKALEAERKNFDEEAKRLLKNPDNKGTLSANLAKAYRDAIDKYVSELAPDLKAAKGGYRSLKQAEDLLSRSTVTSPSVKTPIFGGPLPLAGNIKQVAAEAGGKALQGLGGSSPLARLTRNAAGQVGRRAIVDPLTGQMGAGTAPNTLEGALAGVPSDMGMQGLGGDVSGLQEPQSANPYPRENLLYDIQRDPANAEEYMKQYQMYQELFSTQQPELTASQQNMAVRAQNALGDIDVIEQAITSGDIDKGLIPFSDNSVISNALGTGDMNAALYNLGDVILRARTGAAAPVEEVNKFIAGFLPRAGESLQTKMYKLQRARQELMGMVNPPAALGTGTANTLEDALGSFSY